MVHPAALVLSSICLVSASFAQGPAVAIVASGSSNLSDCRFTDVQNFLVATGQFSAVDIVSSVSQTPTLATLQSYEAVLAFSNINFADEVALGNVMADYVDGGGGVVVSAFANTSSDVRRRLGGRWITGGYEVIETGLGHVTSSASLGMILDPTHPSVQGVSALTASSAFRPDIDATLVQGTVVAEWNDGAILVAQGTMPNRIDLGLYPPPNTCVASSWDITGDGNLLVANSLLAVAGAASEVGTSYCTPNANATGVPAELLATGIRDVNQNDLTLRTSSMPPFSFAFYIVSQTQGFVMNPAGSAGNLCLGGAIGRFMGPGQIQPADASGTISLMLDLTQTPQPNGFVAIQPGETWNYQTWYRDTAGGISTSNFSDGYSITFE